MDGESPRKFKIFPVDRLVALRQGLREGQRRVLENFISLSTLQGLNYFFPLIVLPYLIRVLGPDRYGMVVFAEAFIQYFTILTDYGFHFTATRAISIHRDNKEKRDEIVLAVLAIKFGLLFLAFIIMASIVSIFDRFHDVPILYYITFGIVVGHVLFPGFFFQGVEKMKYITILSLVARGFFTLCIFLFVRKPADFLLVPLFNTIGHWLVGGWALALVFVRFGVHVRRPSWREIKHQLKDGWHIFVSQAVISGYTTSRIFAVGLFTTPVLAGYYAIAEKLMNVVRTFPLASFIQALYPRLSQIYHENRMKAYKVMKILQRWTTLIYGLGVPVLFYLAPWIIRIVCGEPYREVILAFRLLLVAVFFINANAFRIQFLLVSGQFSIYNRIHLVMGLCGVLLTFLLTYFFSYIGTAISIITIAILVLLLTLYFEKRREAIHDAG